MTDQEARYDRIAEGYSACWSPIHRDRTLALLDVIEPFVAAGATRLLDVGCGTGAFAAAAVARWPQVRMTGVDPSSGMLLVADRELEPLPAALRERIDLVQASRRPAAVRGRLVRPRDDGLRAPARPVTLPGRARGAAGAPPRRDDRHAHLAGRRATRWRPDDVYDDVLEAARLRAARRTRPIATSRNHRRSRRLASGGRASSGRRRSATRWTHQFSPDSYLAFLNRFDDEDLFATMDAETRATIEQELLARLRALPADGLRIRLPVAYATARRPARP